MHLGRFHHEVPCSGIERHVASLLSGLAREIVVINLVAAEGPHTFVGHGAGYRVFGAPCFGKLASTALAPGMVTLARRLHREFAFDIVHLHFPDPLSHLVACALPRRVKRVVTWHSDIVRQRRLYLLYRPWLDRFLAGVDAVIAATPANFAASRQLGAVPPERRHAIPFGLDYDVFDRARVRERAQHLRDGLGAKVPCVLAVGRHVYYKGFEYLLEAAANLEDVRLVFVGSGPLTTALQTQASRLGLAERVVWAGQVDEETLAAWYHACDVFCLPSIEPAETFGLVQLEAMACAKPVVSTRLGTGVDHLNVDGVTGYTVPPRDPNALAAALRDILSNSERAQRMGQAAYSRARQDFSRATMVRATLELYRRLIAP